METNNIIKTGYTVSFPLNCECDFFSNLQDAIKTRNMIAGGGIIYYATLQKIGLNTHIIRGNIVRNNFGTPI